jgi:hypothetical protein
MSWVGACHVGIPVTNLEFDDFFLIFKSEDRQKGVQQFVDNHAQHILVCLFNQSLS